MIKIIIVMPVWQRSEILKVVLNQLEKFIEFNSNLFQFKTVFVLSEEDPEYNNNTKNIVKFNKIKEITHYSNQYVSNKTNAGFDIAMKYDFDYIMNIGSDDLLHEYLMTLYLPYIRINKNFFGVDSLYITDFKTKETTFFESYNKPYSVGAGRMISKKVMSDVYGVYGKLYQDRLQRGLDTFSSNRIMKLKFSSMPVKTGTFPYVVDLKSNVNINKFEKFKYSMEINKYIVLNSFNL